ncbi:sulfotransferase domain-containing protein [bacterium]|nr:sulfotransferase domain-containing protein [bacterium]
MVVVTGSARTGTSMLMQTLSLLGVTPVHDKFYSVHSEVKSFNPKGFYESEDLIPEDLLKDGCIKLFGSHLTDALKLENNINKLIVCERDPKQAIDSSVGILDILYPGSNPSSVYHANYYLIHEAIGDIPSLFVKFERMKSNPKLEIKRIVDFLSIEVSELQFNNAVKNID